MDIQFKTNKEKAIQMQQQPVLTQSQTRVLPSEPNEKGYPLEETQLSQQGGNEGSTEREWVMSAAMGHQQQNVMSTNRRDMKEIMLEFLVELVKNQLDSCMTLQECREGAKESRPSISKPGDSRIFWEKGLLYIEYVSKSGKECLITTKQLVVPKASSQRVLQTGHVVPLLGHQDQHKTLARISSTLYWPGKAKDVKEYIPSCQTCQMMDHQHRPPQDSWPRRYKDLE